MRLDARRGDRNYKVFHVPTCREIRDVQWVDDVTAKWCEFVQPLIVIAGDLATVEHQARRIVIDFDARLVLIDPVDGVLDAEEAAGGVADTPQSAGPPGGGSSTGNSNPVHPLVHSLQLS